jgi:hypothetical protein
VTRNQWRSVVTGEVAPVLAESGFTRLKGTSRFVRDWGGRARAVIAFRVSPQFRGLDVSFQVDYWLLFPEAFRRRNGCDPDLAEDGDFQGRLHHAYKFGVDVAPNVWEFDLERDSKVPELRDKLADLCQRLIAVADDPGLLLTRDPIDPFSGPFRAQRSLAADLLVEGTMTRAWEGSSAQVKSFDQDSWDEFLGSVAGPVLGGFGYASERDAFRKCNAAGDEAVVRLRPLPKGQGDVECLIDLELVVRPVAAWEAQVEDLPGFPSGVWKKLMKHPVVGEDHEFGTCDYIAYCRINLADHDRCAGFQFRLEEELGLLDRLLDRQALVAWLSQRHDLPPGPGLESGMLRHNTTPQLAVVLADYGDSSRLQEVLTELESQPPSAEAGHVAASYVRALLADASRSVGPQ